LDILYEKLSKNQQVASTPQEWNLCNLFLYINEDVFNVVFIYNFDRPLDEA